MTLLVTTAAVLVYAERSGALRQEIRQSRQRSCDTLGTRIESELVVARQLVFSLAQLAPQARGDRKASEELLLRLMRSSPKDLVYGMGLWYERDAFGDGTALFGPYVHQSRDGRRLLELSYEWCTETYNFPSQRWYRQGLHVGRGHGFTEPYFDTDDIYVSSVTSFFDDNGGLLGVATVDLTLGTIRRFLNNLERSQDWVYVSTQDGRLLFHPRAKELMERARKDGRTVSSLLDLHLSDLAAPELRGGDSDQYLVQRDIEGVGWTLHLVGSRTRIFAEQGHLRDTLLGVLAGVLLLGGFVAGALWLMEQRHLKDVQARQRLEAEVTERKSREARLKRRHRLLEGLIRRRTEEISRMSANKDRLLSVLAHDMRGHFMVIRSISQLLEESEKHGSETERRESFRHLNESSQLAIASFEDLLLWVKLQSNRVELRPTVIHWRTAAASVLPQLESQARLKGVHIMMEPGEDFAFLGDLGMVQTVLRNLGGNAIKFTPRGGSVILRSRKETHDGAPLAVLEVEDTGVGMEPEEAAQIFARREPLSNPGTAGEKGTGLGLFICQEMCLRLQGRIWMRSLPGKGTVVSFTLPLHDRPPRGGALH
jgi:signal transduction histidine kinase